MRITYYLILFSLIFIYFSSCSKGDVIRDPQFGRISFVSPTPGQIDSIAGDRDKFTVNAGAVSIISGKSRFRFYSEKVLLQDTLLSVEPFTTRTYTLFKPYTDSNLKIFDSSLNGLNKEVLPDSGFVKFSIANLSESLPGKVNVYISTTTYTPSSEKPIQVGELLNVSSSFSKFQTIMVGINQSSRVINKFTLTIKDAGNNSLLATIPLVLPVSTTAGTIGQLTAGIYLLYLGNSGTVNILMSK